MWGRTRWGELARGRNRQLPVSEFIIHQIHLLARDWSIRVTWLNTLHLKMGNIRVEFPSFQICTCCEKYLKDNKHNSLLLLAWKNFQIFGLGHYLFLEAQFSESVRFSEQIMSVDKYLAIFSSQLKAMVYTSPALWNVDEITHIHPYQPVVPSEKAREKPLFLQAFRLLV